ncbi:MAG: hypothetical protein QY331_13305 [Melioribacteraceae bacterium]|jgi:hypothetical protein|nr:hypothetical protein [Melioribacteraceae bacterium]WKZ68931.1 MAG: hypothetical protein QY331_13305 [Melioribacteraceae bacterium]
MSKGQNVKKNTKKTPLLTKKEKKNAKRDKKNNDLTKSKHIPL